MLLRIILLFYSVLLAKHLIFSKKVTVSNTKNLIDTDGNLVITGELNIVLYDSTYYLFMDNYGCADYGGKSPCVYMDNHTFVLYSTKDFTSFENHGVILNYTQRPPGVIFRPHVIHNKKTDTFVMIYQYRPSGQKDYAIATSKNIKGPYNTIIKKVELKKCAPMGDFGLFVDDDGTAYIILTHYNQMCIEKLDETYTKGTGEFAVISPKANSEAPAMLKRNGYYYLFFGKCCCACTIGANIYVYKGKSPLGDYEYLGDIGTNKDGTFTTKSQQCSIFPIADNQLVWTGNNWGSDSKTHMFNRDLLYFYPLVWNSNGTVHHVEWKDNVEFDIPDDIKN